VKRLLALACALLLAAEATAFSSMGEIRAGDLPAEARAVLALIRAGGPFRYEKDGAAFGNREGRLPRQGRGYYREYTVTTHGLHDRGARRIITGQDGDRYYTDDHYGTFRRILE
jgi:ribonuclease T1